jgi:hypothetical protein
MSCNLEDGVTFQKIVILKLTAMKTSNLIHEAIYITWNYKCPFFVFRYVLIISQIIQTKFVELNQINNLRHASTNNDPVLENKTK